MRNHSIALKIQFDYYPIRSALVSTYQTLASEKQVFLIAVKVSVLFTVFLWQYGNHLISILLRRFLL